MKQILSKAKHSTWPFGSITPNAKLRSGSLETADDADITPSAATSSSSVPISERTQTELVRNVIQQRSLLEELPPEVRRHILYVLRIKELCALVHASPVFHQQYVLDRKSLLSASLETTLGDIVVDAAAVFQSGWADYWDLSAKKGIAQFLDSYQSQRVVPQRPTVITLLAEDEAASLVAFHIAVVEPLVQVYASWALANLTEETGDAKGQKPLSKMEEARLFRAFYRFQLCCNLFGMGRATRLRARRYEFDSLDILRFFFCLFEPWEVEEIACIYTFAKVKYTKIFDDIRWDVHKDNPRFEFDPYPPTPKGAFDFDNKCECFPNL
jgi:hypothetical protein